MISRCDIPADRMGLTLLELMVVMVILAIVATVAMQSLQPQVDNRRFQAATQMLESIDVAIGGPTQKFQSDGTPLVSGYVADMGCFPGLRSIRESTTDLGSSFKGVNENSLLESLWRTDSELANQFPFQFRAGPNQPVDYSAIRLPCGWRGPYLQLAAGQTELKDPWGRAPELLTDVQNQLFTVRIPIPESSSLGSQVLARDLSTCKVQVTGKVAVPNPEKTTVQVALLTPNPNSSLTQLSVLDDEDPEPDSFLFSNVPIGLRAVVADVDGVRQVKYIQVPRGGANLVFDFQQ